MDPVQHSMNTEGAHGTLIITKSQKALAKQTRLHGFKESSLNCSVQLGVEGA